MAIPTSPNARLFYRAAIQRVEDAEYLFAVERTTASVYLAGYGHDYEWLTKLYSENTRTELPRRIVTCLFRVNTWSTDMRYLTGVVDIHETRSFLDAVLEVMQWVDGRV